MPKRHPHEVELLAAFCAWDADAMASTAQKMIEAHYGKALDAEGIKDIKKGFRRYFKDGELHPNFTNILSVNAAGDYLLKMVIELRGDEYERLGFTFAPYFKRDAKVRDRWKKLGYSSDEIMVPRAKVETAVPLKGEKGYGRTKPKPKAKPKAAPKPEQSAPDVTWARGLAQATGKGPWLKRYRAGEHAAVWREMTRLGPKVREPKVFGDAVDVAMETMRRVRASVELVHERLVDGGYEFARPKRAFVAAKPNVARLIASLEKKVGSTPLSICAFYTVVGEVDFCGQHTRWKSPGEAILDPLVVSPASYVLVFDEDNQEDEDEPYQLSLAPDAYHKEEISGGPAYTMLIPNAAADGDVLHAPGEPSFVGMLRDALSYGGFPGFGTLAAGKRPKAELARLTAGLATF